jgi:hypothetical protein
MAEQQPQWSREEVRQRIDAARERLDARRHERAREQSQEPTVAQRYYDGVAEEDAARHRARAPL